MLHLPLKATIKNFHKHPFTTVSINSKKKENFYAFTITFFLFFFKAFARFLCIFCQFFKKQTKKKISIIQTRARISQKMILWDFISLFSYSVPSYAHHVMIIMPQMIFFYVLCCHILQFIIFFVIHNRRQRTQFNFYI